LFVVGGCDGISPLNSGEYYNPNTNSWTMVKAPMAYSQLYLVAVAIDNPQYYKALYS